MRISFLFLVEPKVQHEAEVRTPSSLALIRQELKQQYLLAQKLIEKGSTEEECEELLADINVLKAELYEAEEAYRAEQLGEIAGESEGAGIWETDEISIAQLIIEYGSQEYLYVIPSDVA